MFRLGVVVREERVGIRGGEEEGWKVKSRGVDGILKTVMVSFVKSRWISIFGGMGL